MERVIDVAILGGGLAGGLLARQLRREAPTASVVLVEKEREPGFKVGESTVDVFGKYLTKRLGLSSYLYDQQLPKNGLRFFFDREDRKASLEEMSEIGSTGLLPLPSFQLDRARLERDVLAMNAEDGVDVRVGAKVIAVRLGGEPPHEIEIAYDDGARTETIRARWVVDATGRASLLARQLGLRTETSVTRAAVWGRFRGVVDLDDHGPDAWRARVRHTSRTLSTNHLCYPGYWIWLIPLGRGVTSVGVVMERELFRDGYRSKDGFLDFLRSHRAMAELLGRAEVIDRMSFGQLAYGVKRAIDARSRWALIGEAAAFTDPLYSPGGDFIALMNDWVTDLVRRDLGGESDAELVERADLYDQLFALRHRATLLLHEEQYDLLGSFEVFASKWDFDQSSYLNLWVEPYMLDLHLDLGAVREEVAAAPQAIGVLRTFQHVFTDAARALRREGRFFEKNLGHTVLDPAARFLSLDFGRASSRRRALPRARDAMQLVLHELDDKMGRPRAEPVPFSRLTLGRPLVHP